MNKPNEKTTPGQEIVESNRSVTEQEPVVNDYDIDAFLQKRKEFITKVNKIMVEGKDYHVIQNKKSLAKGGAEKIASIFGWSAEFRKDEDVTGSFKIEGLIAYVCNLSKSEKYVGQGRGAAILVKNAGDPNKTIKMAQKSAFIDAVLRASGLSDFFTQDLEDMGVEQINHLNSNSAINADSSDWEGAPKAVKPASVKQIRYIKGLMEQKGVDRKDPKIEAKLESLTSEDASKWIDKLNSMPDKEDIETIDISEL